MSIVLLGTLAVLALIDSTSIGTLVIPIWLLLEPGRIIVSRYFLYLATIAVFYFGVGVALILGIGSLLDAYSHLLDTPAAAALQLALGVGLFLLAVLPSSETLRRRGAERYERWRQRIATSSASPDTLVRVALVAGLAEVTTMLPYLGAIGLLSTSDINLALRPVVLAGYVVVMVAPALVLLAIRLAVHGRAQPVLERLNGWMARSAGEATAWAMGIAGFYIAGDAAGRLFGS